MTIDQKIQIANIIAKANPQNVPAILEMFGMKPKPQPRQEVKIHTSVSNFLYICGSVSGRVSSEVYAAYRSYCELEKIQPLPHVEFSRQVTKAVNTTTVAKRFKEKVCRIFN